MPNVPAGHVNIHGHQHAAIKLADSPHIDVSVEQIDYRPVALVAGERPAGATTPERIEEVQ